ncbi:Putative NADH-flavin reductase [Helicobacter fennelliae]|uniref:Rrf2-linked NADH-flavin reductase n=2 Tax=Helicobacter fennelliae TaxID=215 RepID=T1CPN5_9HELI|nr:Rrf2-linked NADH-flavin reductase [Helicobacter fennelliae MRY12-0050]STP07112.1 Putative NADH-flavin reductase [Helicobacter fennelliae]STQ83340.1 Putative NADH-flavin reductase [Helicobacter fennelliae]
MKNLTKQKINRRSFLKTSVVGALALGVGFMPIFAKPNKKGDKMKIAILAASGKAGKLITQEALNRGYEVTAFVRDSTKMSKFKNLKVVQKDILALDSKDLSGFDVVISAYGVVATPQDYEPIYKHLSAILANNPARFLIVGGAGSYYMDKERKTQFIDTPEFPDIYKPVASAHNKVLSFLRTQDSLNWVYVSPPADFVFDAPKSGKYKIIGEYFEVNERGESKGSYADYASAMLDIAEDSKINKERVGVIGL